MKKINLIYGFLTGLIILFYCSNAGAAQVNEEKVLIRISYQSKAEERRVKALNLDIVEEKPGEYIETKLTWEEIIKLHARNFDLSYVIEIEFPPIDSTYHSPSEIQSTLFNLASEYASIVSLDTIGRSTRYNRPIWAVKISDNPHLDEDESRILLTGAHHAREPLSTEVCLYLIKKFCNNYHQDQKIFHWINETEIWIVPVVNPDGYALIFDPTHNLRWWRKNLRDNNVTGIQAAAWNWIVNIIAVRHRSPSKKFRHLSSWRKINASPLLSIFTVLVRQFYTPGVILKIRRICRSLPNWPPAWPRRFEKPTDQVVMILFPWMPRWDKVLSGIMVAWAFWDSLLRWEKPIFRRVTKYFRLWKIMPAPWNTFWNVCTGPA